MAEKVGFTPEASTSASSPPMAAATLHTSVDETLALLARGRYVGERSLATVLFLALKLGRPLFPEGEAGVGKTETRSEEHTSELQSLMPTTSAVFCLKKNTT